MSANVGQMRGVSALAVRELCRRLRQAQRQGSSTVIVPDTLERWPHPAPAEAARALLRDTADLAVRQGLVERPAARRWVASQRLAGAYRPKVQIAAAEGLSRHQLAREIARTDRQVAALLPVTWSPRTPNPPSLARVEFVVAHVEAEVAALPAPQRRLFEPAVVRIRADRLKHPIRPRAPGVSRSARQAARRRLESAIERHLSMGTLPRTRLPGPARPDRDRIEAVHHELARVHIDERAKLDALLAKARHAGALAADMPWELAGLFLQHQQTRWREEAHPLTLPAAELLIAHHGEASPEAIVSLRDIAIVLEQRGYIEAAAAVAARTDRALHSLQADEFDRRVHRVHTGLRALALRGRKLTSKHDYDEAVRQLRAIRAEIEAHPDDIETSIIVAAYRQLDLWLMWQRNAQASSVGRPPTIQPFPEAQLLDDAWRVDSSPNTGAVWRARWRMSLLQYALRCGDPDKFAYLAHEATSFFSTAELPAAQQTTFASLLNRARARTGAHWTRIAIPSSPVPANQAPPLPRRPG